MKQSITGQVKRSGQPSRGSNSEQVTKGAVWGCSITWCRWCSDEDVISLGGESVYLEYMIPPLEHLSGVLVNFSIWLLICGCLQRKISEWKLDCQGWWGQRRSHRIHTTCSRETGKAEADGQFCFVSLWRHSPDRLVHVSAQCKQPSWPPTQYPLLFSV